MTRPACVSDALAVLARSTGIQHGEVGIANAVVLGYVEQLEHRNTALRADAALVQWARADIAAVQRLREAVRAALDRGDTDSLGRFLRAVHGVLAGERREVA